MIEEYNAAIKELQDEFIKKIKPKFLQVLDDFNIEGYRWVQYTPYFNDGDPCVFSVYEAEILYEGEFYDFFKTHSDGKWFYKTEEHERLDAVRKKVNEFLFSINADVMNVLFGDHVEITVTKEGVEVEDYDHE